MEKTGEITDQTPDDQQLAEKRAGADEKDHPAFRTAEAVRVQTEDSQKRQP